MIHPGEIPMDELNLYGRGTLLPTEPLTWRQSPSWDWQLRLGAETYRIHRCIVGEGLRSSETLQEIFRNWDPSEDQTTCESAEHLDLLSRWLTLSPHTVTGLDSLIPVICRSVFADVREKDAHSCLAGFLSSVSLCLDMCHRATRSARTCGRF